MTTPQDDRLQRRRRLARPRADAAHAVPFLRGFGLGGLLVPAVSMLCALTLLPALLLALGERLERLRLFSARLAQRRDALKLRLWTRHTGWTMRSAKWLRPRRPCSSWRRCRWSASGWVRARSAHCRRASLREGAGRAAERRQPLLRRPHDHRRRAVRRPPAHRRRQAGRLLRADPQVTSVSAPRPDRSGRYVRIDVGSRPDPAARRRSPSREAPRTLIPARTSLPRRSSSPAAVRLRGGLRLAQLGSFPLLIAGVLGLTYLALVRAFRSLLLPPRRSSLTC